MKHKIALLVFFIGFLAIEIYSQSPPPSHERYSKLLKAHVSANGKVDYKGFIRDSADFNQYLKSLSKNAPGKNWTRNEIKAFWINAYNAFTIKLIIDNYPVKSIKDLGGWIYKVNTPWDIKFITIGGEKLDLNNIEHAKLRRDFDDPRIHFAVVCASKSCPKLLNEAYEASKLDQQLDQAGRDFLSDSFRNKIGSSKVELSSIFKWYRGDFTKKGSLLNFINNYAPVKINSNAPISYLEYDWNLNE